MLRYMRERLPPGRRHPVAATPPPPPPSTGGPSSEGFGAKGVAPTKAVSAAGTKGGAEKEPEGVEEAPAHGEALAKIAGLKSEVDALAGELEAPGLSQAKAYALKKKLQMKRAALIREERALARPKAAGGL